MTALQDGKTNILFVGRIAPNKKQDDLVAAFSEYLAFDPTARLILVGKAEPHDPYAAHVYEVIRSLGLQETVIMPGSVNDAQLAACYRTADLFWSMSEHEGFCVPLIEAMWFDVPVFAYRSTAVPETLGSGGLLFNMKEDPVELAAAAHLLVSDPQLRDAIRKQQRIRREAYLSRRVSDSLQSVVNGIIDARASSRSPARRTMRMNR